MRVPDQLDLGIEAGLRLFFIGLSENGVGALASGRLLLGLLLEGEPVRIELVFDLLHRVKRVRCRTQLQLIGLTKGPLPGGLRVALRGGRRRLI